MKRSIWLMVFIVLLSLHIQAQSPNPNNKSKADLTSFFVVNWAGDGEFPNGKKISADLTIKPSLDSCWLSFEHIDKAPNQFKFQSMWGVDMFSGQFVAYIFDNFQGHRKFVSEGWKDGKIVLTTNEFYPQKGLFFQHFIHEKLTDKSFKMTFETSKDAITWKLIDYLVFTKQ